MLINVSVIYLEVLVIDRMKEIFESLQNLRKYTETNELKQFIAIIWKWTD